MDRGTVPQRQFGPPIPRRTLSLWEGRDSTTPLPTPQSKAVLTPRHDNDVVRQQRGDNVNRLLAACNTASAQAPGRPRNAADLAVSLVGLVFPYDVRNMQRSLARLHTRIKVVESRAAQQDEATSIRIEQCRKMIESEMSLFRSLHGKTPTSHETITTSNLTAKIQDIGAEMIAKAKSNGNNINQALQMMESMVSNLRHGHAQLQREGAGGLHRTQATTPFTNIDDMSTASEDDEAVEVQMACPGSGNKKKSRSLLVSREALDEARLQPDEPRVDAALTGILVGSDMAPPTQKRNRDRPARSKDAAALDDAEGSPPRQTRTLRRTRVREEAKKAEGRTTENNGIVKKSPLRAQTRVPARRLAFTAYTKQTDVRFRSQKPHGTRGHRDFLWEYLDNMEDKDMSRLVQQMMSEQFCQHVAKLRGKGKPGRQIKITGNVEWPQLLGAIKSMPIPGCLQNDG